MEPTSRELLSPRLRTAIVLGLGGPGLYLTITGNPIPGLIALVLAARAASPFFVHGLFALPKVANRHANGKWQGRSYMYEGVRVRAEKPEDASMHALIAVEDIENLTGRTLKPRPNAETPGDGVLKGVECLRTDAILNHLRVMERLAKKDRERQQLRSLVIWIEATFAKRVTRSQDDDKRLSGNAQRT